MPGLIPKDLVVHTSWKPDNEIFSRVQVQTEYNFQFITAQLIFSQATIPLLRASPVMVINPSPTEAQSTNEQGSHQELVSPAGVKACNQPIFASATALFYGPAGISHQPTVEARAKPAIAWLRLVAVRDVGFKYARIVQETERRATRLVPAAFSRTSPRHVVRNAG